MNSEHMCIDDSRHRSTAIRLLEAAATTMVWLAYFGILPFIWAAITQRGAQTAEVSVFFGGSGTRADGLGFGSFLAQLFTVVLCGSSLLYVWARYNGVRFRGNERRKAAVAVTATDLAAYYGGTPEQIQTLQDARRLYMRHDADGRLMQIDYEKAPDPRDLATHCQGRVHGPSGNVLVFEAPTRLDAGSTQEPPQQKRAGAM